jgi:hypothetical protein
MSLLKIGQSKQRISSLNNANNMKSLAQAESCVCRSVVDQKIKYINQYHVDNIKACEEREGINIFL